jgi:glycosyltransferase involved in cell wall biosynthesis
MQLTVLSVAYPFAPVRLGAVGGAEEILAALDHALVQAGNRSLVIAREGSRTEGLLFETAVPSDMITSETRSVVRRRHQENLDRALQSFNVDLIHLHGIDFPSYRLPTRIPILATLHLPPSWYPHEIWSLAFSHIQLQCVSRFQRYACPRDQRHIPVIENGVDIDPLLPHAKRNFAVVLGRICPEKNLHVALEAGIMAKIPVLLGGQVFPYPEHIRYFHEQIEPRLTNCNRFLGPLPAQRKKRLLRGARCLLIPSLVPESSSLAAMEALAAGTPVIAFPSGALPEIIEHGVTGLIVNNFEEMADAIRGATMISPETCRQTAMRRFSRQRMIDQYFSLYKQMLLSRLASGDHYNVAV